jgi:hypothetical protein
VLLPSASCVQLASMTTASSKKSHAGKEKRIRHEIATILAEAPSKTMAVVRCPPDRRSAARRARQKVATVLVYSRPSGYWYAQAFDATTGKRITEATEYSREGVLRELRGKFAMIGVTIKSVTEEDPYAKTAVEQSHAVITSGKVPSFKISVKDPSVMGAAEINKELDKLGKQNSALGQLMIDTGRGYERPSEYLRLTDPLALELRKNADRRQALRIEISRRYGPDHPARLPAGRGFGPRKVLF